MVQYGLKMCSSRPRPPSSSSGGPPVPACAKGTERLSHTCLGPGPEARQRRRGRHLRGAWGPISCGRPESGDSKRFLSPEKLSVKGITPCQAL